MVLRIVGTMVIQIRTVKEPVDLDLAVATRMAIVATRMAIVATRMVRVLDRITSAEVSLVDRS
jgi:hypothetical protein